MAEETLDPALLEQTKNQIRTLVSEIAELAESDIQPAEFQAEFLNRVVAAVAATGGALWTLDPKGQIRLTHQLEFRQTGLLENSPRSAPHNALLGAMIRANSPQLIPPGAAVEGMPNAGNPTALAIILAPVIVDKAVIGLVEVLMDPARKAANQRSTLRFVGDLCDLASQYYKNRQVRQMMSQQKLWNQLEGYTHAIHQSLDLQEACYSVANHGKRLAGCDRLSVALKLAAKTRVEAVSGQEVVEQRSNLIRELTRLCKVVMHSGEDLVYTGNTEGFPPEIRDALEIYVDESGSKAIVVTLLHKPEGEEEKKGEKVTYGCLVAEQIGDEMAPTDMHARCEVLSRHASTALWNASTHDKIALRPVLNLMSSPRRYLRGRTLAKILAGVAVAVGTVLVLALVPWRLTIEGRGSILPDRRSNLYAPLSGTIVEVPHDHADFVRGPHPDADGNPAPGDLLARLQSDELDKTRKQLEAQEREAYLQIETLTQVLEDTIGKADERRKAGAELDQAEIKRRSAMDQLQIIDEQLAKMEVRAPHDGIVTTWDVRKSLMGRPVDVGQDLLQVAAVEGDWVHEVDVPDHDMAPILEAKSRLDTITEPLRKARDAFDADVAANGPTPALNGRITELEAGLDHAEDADSQGLVNVDPARRALSDFAAELDGKDAVALAESKAKLDRELDNATSLSAYFVSAADPEHRYPGHVKRIAAKAELAEQQHVVKVTVGFSESVLADYLKRNKLEHPRPGAEVRVRINCGDARLAYVLLRDVVQFWHESVLFRWPFLR